VTQFAQHDTTPAYHISYLKHYPQQLKMKSFSFPVLVVALVAVDQVQAFGGSFAGSKLSNSVANNAAMNMEYIPK